MHFARPSSPIPGPVCPLCATAESLPYHQCTDRAFHQCRRCDLVFVAPEDRLPYDQEIARYRHHQNDERDPAYIAFLSRLAHPVIARTAPGARGIDYGSGVSPALAGILTQSGRPTIAYDPVFRPDATALEQRYDFLTCSEVIEHAHAPLDFFTRTASLLHPAGLIAIMTTFRDPGTPFGEWWYARDPTHVCFYSTATFTWVAKRFGWTLELPAPNVALFIT